MSSINSWQQALPFVSHQSQDIMTLKCLCWVTVTMTVCPGSSESILTFLLRKFFNNYNKMSYFMYFKTHSHIRKKKKRPLKIMIVGELTLNPGQPCVSFFITSPSSSSMQRPPWPWQTLAWSQWPFLQWLTWTKLTRILLQMWPTHPIIKII